MAFGFTYYPCSPVCSLLNFFYLSDLSRHWFRHFASQNIWGELKILLLDTTFWSQLSSDPDRYGEKFRQKLNLLDNDFVIMPMFELYVHLFF